MTGTKLSPRQISSEMATDDEVDSAIAALQSQIDNPEVKANFTRTGKLAVFTGIARWYPTRNIVLDAFEAWVGITSQGADILISILKNGTPVLTVTITAGTNYVSGAANISMLTTDYLTINITQVGIAAPGDELNLRLKGN